MTPYWVNSWREQRAALKNTFNKIADETDTVRLDALWETADRQCNDLINVLMCARSESAKEACVVETLLTNIRSGRPS